MPFIKKSTPSHIHKAKLQRKPTGEQGNYNSAWAKMSRSYRRANPLCECCLVRGIMTDITPGDYKGCVDHMIPITRGGSMYNLSNLLALCKECHDYKSTEEGKGIPPVSIYMDSDGKMAPRDKVEVIAWLSKVIAERARERARKAGNDGGGDETRLF